MFFKEVLPEGCFLAPTTAAGHLIVGGQQWLLEFIFINLNIRRHYAYYQRAGVRLVQQNSCS